MDSTHMNCLVRYALVGALALAALAHSGFSLAQQRGRSNFDHLRTSFPLTGVHAITPCESCHIGGKMAGTPSQCAYCHRAGSRIAETVMPTRHVPTNEPCELCHRSAATWTGARFSHVSVTPGTCFSCHNGVLVSGKPANHMVTTMSCDACHRTLAWLPAAGFDHTGVVPGTCDKAGCHSPGGSGLQLPPNHIPYQTQLLAGSSMSCDRCHLNTTSFAAERMDHNGSQGNGSGWCKGCHLSGTNYLGSMTHMTLHHGGGTDCSQSGCHRPIGTLGTPYSRWTN